ncbi:MAG TPA: 2-oxoglutarate dehydrogenase E1 component, partial [Saprospiraceae bacterium]|nr:2-oxoglutarate dehydrogenase E1 component [Saprospiraceae bacterium]
DFVNGAQTIIDQFITTGMTKWHRMNGLVMLLPHGYEGQGPEHSSARLERWLQNASELNMAITNITTPANFFHALRRQLAWDFRIPLVVMSPKSLLRHPECVSRLEDFSENTSFLEVIDDKSIANTARVTKVLLCSGKIYYDLIKYRRDNKLENTAIVRIEQLYPFPASQLDEILKKYKTAKIVWVQEEPVNMGAATFVQQMLGKSLSEMVARAHVASPASGFKRVHDTEQAELLKDAFA